MCGMNDYWDFRFWKCYDNCSKCVKLKRCEDRNGTILLLFTFRVKRVIETIAVKNSQMYYYLSILYLNAQRGYCVQVTQLTTHSLLTAATRPKFSPCDRLLLYVKGYDVRLFGHKWSFCANIRASERSLQIINNVQF